MSNTYRVIRKDGKGFTKLLLSMNIEEPNDLRWISLTNQAVIQVMKTYQDI